jgi:hypothetical protein
MFIFNLTVVFTIDFLKMVPIQEQDFTERNLRQHGSKQLHQKCAMLDQLTKPTKHIEPVSSP